MMTIDDSEMGDDSSCDFSMEGSHRLATGMGCLERFRGRKQTSALLISPSLHPGLLRQPIVDTEKISWEHFHLNCIKMN